MNDLTQSAPYLRAIQLSLPGTIVTIRPARPGDVQPILDMHQRLSSDSLYLRYLVPSVPASIPAHIHDICTGTNDRGAALVATNGTQVIGFGYYVVNQEQPDTAEPALLVEDSFQGQGIGRQLLDRLIDTARTQGVRFFDALTHASNRQVLHLLRHSGRPVTSKRDGSHVAVLLSLAPSAA